MQNPGSGKAFYEADKMRAMLHDTGKTKARGTVVAVPERTIILTENAHAQSRLHERGLTVAEVHSFIDNAEFALKQQGGRVYAFYSKKGFAAIDINGELRTAGYLNAGGINLYYKVVEIIGRYEQ